MLINQAAFFLADHGNRIEKTFVFAKDNIRPTILDLFKYGAWIVYVKYEGQYFFCTSNPDGTYNRTEFTSTEFNYDQIIQLFEAK